MFAIFLTEHIHFWEFFYFWSSYNLAQKTSESISISDCSETTVEYDIEEEINLNQLNTERNMETDNTKDKNGIEPALDIKGNE